MAKVQTILAGLNFPESPVFDSTGNLWFVEIKGGNLACWNGRELTRYNVDGTPNGMRFNSTGQIVFTDSGRGAIRQFDPVNRSFKTLCTHTVDDKPLKRPNDLIFDIAGNLLFSDHADGRQEPVSTICVLPVGSDRALVVSNKKFFTNGMAFRKDNKTLLFAETYRQQIWTAQWDTDCLFLSDERVFAKAGKGPQGPDGMVLDEDENLYVAVFNESKVDVFDKQGRIIRTLQCKGRQPTSCTFGPSGKPGLVVTEAEWGEIVSFQQP